MHISRHQSGISYKQGQRKKYPKTVDKKSDALKASSDNSISIRTEEMKNYSQWENERQTQSQY